MNFELIIAIAVIAGFLWGAFCGFTYHDMKTIAKEKKVEGKFKNGK